MKKNIKKTIKKDTKKTKISDLKLSITKDRVAPITLHVKENNDDIILTCSRIDANTDEIIECEKCVLSCNLNDMIKDTKNKDIGYIKEMLNAQYNYMLDSFLADRMIHTTKYILENMEDAGNFSMNNYIDSLAQMDLTELNNYIQKIYNILLTINKIK